MPSAQVTITQLPAAGPITGTESVPIVQNGQTVQTTTAAIANSPTQTQTFITLNQQPTLPNSRALSVGSGLSLTDGGALSTLQIGLTGAVASLDSSTTGLQAKTGSSTIVGRTIIGSTGVSVTNGNGISGNPTIGLNGTVGSLAGLVGTGILGIVGGSTVTAVEITGTANEIDVANGTGPSNPTIGISDNPTIPGTGAMILPSGTTGERPGGSAGQVRFNSTTNRFEGYTSSWSTIGTGDGTVTSVNASGGTTGLSFTGGPILTSGTLTLTGTPTKATNVAGGAANKVVYQTGTDTTGFIDAPVSGDTFLKWNGSGFEWDAVAGAGTVTSVDGSGGTTGLTLTGGPITAAGTLTIGGTLITSNGGTGLTSYTAGDTLYYSTGTTLSALAIGSSTYVMTSSGTAPQWSDPSGLTVGNATNATTATNVASGAANQIVYNTASGTTSFITAPTVANTYLEWSGSAFQWSSNPLGTVTSVGLSLPADFTVSNSPVTSSGTLTAVWASQTANTFLAAPNGSPGAPSFRAIAVADVPTLNQNTTGSAGSASNIIGGMANQIPYQTAATTTSFITAPSVSNTYLEWTGSAFQWSTVTAGVSSVTASSPLASSGGSTPDISLTGTVATGNGGTGLSTYTAGDLVYYATGTALSKLGIGASTYLLTSSGTAPQWSDPTGVTVGTATNATNATNVAVTASTTNATFYPAFVDATTGNQGIEVGTGLTFNPSTNVLTTTTFAGALNGNADTATTATNANNVAISTTTTNASFYLAFVDATTGNQAIEVDTDFTYNPSTNTLTTGTLVATAGISGGTF